MPHIHSCLYSCGYFLSILIVTKKEQDGITNTVRTPWTVALPEGERRAGQGARLETDAEGGHCTQGALPCRPSRGLSGERARIAMGDQDPFERILASLHDAMLDDTRWPGTSALIDEACDLTGNDLIVSEGPNDDLSRPRS